MQKDQMQQVKVDNLTDDQIRKLVAEMKRNKVAYADVDKYAKAKGFTEAEAGKLKNRIEALGLDKQLDASSGKEGTAGEEDEYSNRDVNDATDKMNIDSKMKTREEKDMERGRSRVYGSELFSNRNLTFEPNLRIPTPLNYRLAADDEVLIDVYGYSEVQHKLKVTPEGYIRIPNLGPVYVSGLTMEEAKNRITKQLATIYSGINAGTTSVQISLGNIRSIRVLMIGEIRKPGTYTVPSLASVANALYVSGGPNENGSFRDIQVIRNGQAIKTFDLYDFLLNGDLSNNIILQDQDIVKVNPYKTRVELSGEVKHPAIFEAKDQETLQQIIKYAGGYTDLAFRDALSGYRVNNKEREVINIPADQIATFKVKSGDQFFVDSILNRFSNRVTITGAVFHPGNYALTNGMTLLDLIKRADGVKEIASLSRGYIRRMQVDYVPAILSFNLQDVLAGKNTITLQREDSVVIYSKMQLRENYEVSITGEVNQPGSFLYADSMHLEDIVLMAGGLSDAASYKRVEVSRRVRNREYNPADSSRAIIKQFDINGDLKSVGDDMNFLLEPFDIVTIRKSPAYSTQATVAIGGEVVYPGNYTIITRKERISDLLQRTGGLRPDAYPEGAVLMRKTYANVSDSILLSSKLELFYNKLQDSSDIEQVKRTVNRREQLVGINLEEIMKKPGSKYDLLLEDGDVIRIPKKLQTVQVFGEIYFPKKIRFDKSYTFRDYISGTGGYTSSALKRRSYVVYANGEVKNTRKVLFFNSYPKVKPGAEIYIPSKKEKKGLSGQEIVGLSSGIASIALIIVTILTRTK
ncbi:SLBB domain-containing protein [Chitinophaga nivalis]|uniref:SLBB domain-containing protein n=1 Tax=Chitinophaga nivalis TaxID=2991709 RepID=A0ABT3IW52_9BACT|nr:SLBB domain-containing protein [Chitinophaga nivalis]MCW3462086.1 SLBB domain-containing protein [Chitinophaga nivalis]MCW3488222.1 SLBB domain-containing protein [Chitinophaga nivalis]